MEWGKLYKMARSRPLSALEFLAEFSIRRRSSSLLEF